MDLAAAAAAFGAWLRSAWPTILQALKAIFYEQVGEERQRNKQDETDLEAYRQREKDRREVDGLSDDALDRELRDPPN